jgi:predicted transglutaminase-like cysteine proteinase
MTRIRYAIRGRGECHPARLIKHSPQTEILRHRDGETVDIVETILYMDAHSGQWILTDQVECLRGATDYDTLHNVWRFVKKNIRYRADRVGHERVKSPGALYASREGDCKSFSIAEGALLRALGFPYKYRFTAYEPGDFTHVYVVTSLDGREVILDAVNDKGHRAGFDHEVRYYKKKDIRPAGVSGIGKAPPTGRTPWGQYFVIGFFMYLIFK